MARLVEDSKCGARRILECVVCILVPDHRVLSSEQKKTRPIERKIGIVAFERKLVDFVYPVLVVFIGQFGSRNFGLTNLFQYLAWLDYEPVETREFGGSQLLTQAFITNHGRVRGHGIGRRDGIAAGDDEHRPADFAGDLANDAACKIAAARFPDDSKWLGADDPVGEFQDKIKNLLMARYAFIDFLTAVARDIDVDSLPAGSRLDYGFQGIDHVPMIQVAAVEHHDLPRVAHDLMKNGLFHGSAILPAT
jgi:hypothetical protein